MNAPADAPAPAASWRRLHPLSPALHAAKALLVVVAVFLPRFVNPLAAGGGVPWTEIVGGAVLVVAGLVTWLVTRWRVERGELQIETGLLRRQSIRVPLSRLQAVDVVRPLLARTLGLAELRLVLAGSGTGHTRLAYLTAEQANRVRAELLALAKGAGLRDTGAADPPERRLLSVDTATLLAAVACSPGAVAAVVVAGGVAAAAVLTGRPALVLAVCWPLVLATLGVTARRLEAEFGFTAAETADGLRLRSGALQTRVETVPAGRVQAVRWSSPALWWPFGWHRLEVDIARQRTGHDAGAAGPGATRALLPVGTGEAAAGLLARVLPGSGVVPPIGSGPPRRARLRAPLSYRNLAIWHDDRYVCTRTGRLRPTVVVVPLEKMQSLREVQGPVQRRLGLATLHVDTVGRGWHAVAHHRDAGEARLLLLRLAALSRAARRTAQPARGAAPGAGAEGAADIRLPGDPARPTVPSRPGRGTAPPPHPGAPAMD